jgi:tetratricopeptide (TPR) repeat protein
MSVLRAGAAALPADAGLRTEIGFAWLDGWRPEEAAAAFREALYRKPGSRDASYGLGLARRALGEPQAAIGAFRDALAADPHMPAAHLELDRCEQRLNVLQPDLPLPAQKLVDRGLRQSGTVRARPFPELVPRDLPASQLTADGVADGALRRRDRFPR